jgi:ribonuclease BN (tRNA processing enzyme)
MSYNINLKFIGTGTISPNPDRSCTCILLETPKEKILIDIGSGSLHRLAIENIDIHSINYIFLTHFHPDHIGDLIPFLFAIRNTRTMYRKEKLHVVGPKGLMNFLKGAETSYGRWIKDPVMNVKYSELGRRLLDYPGFRVIWNKVIHKTESVGYRFEIGEYIISFSGDSGYCRELINLCQKADIAILECSHADEHAIEGHLSPSLSAKIAEEASVGKMFLTHFYPDALESDIINVASKFYNGKIVLAEDGMEISLPEDKIIKN